MESVGQITDRGHEAFPDRVMILLIFDRTVRGVPPPVT
jgi:hypothetical protein